MLHTSYSSLPTSDSSGRSTENLPQLDIDEPPSVTNAPVITRRRVLFAVVFLFAAFVFYKAGQSSVRPSTPVPDQPPKESLPEKDRPCSSEDPTMPCDGKYSVG